MLKGSLVAIVSPMLEDGSLDLDALHQLIDWIRVAVSLLTEDSAIIEEYIAQLERLTVSPKQGKTT